MRGGPGCGAGGRSVVGGGEGAVGGGGSADPPLFSVPPPSPGNVPGRLQAWPRRAPPVSLAFLEAVLSHVGLSEVHKAIALFLDAPPAMGGPQHTQRYPTTLRPPVPMTPGQHLSVPFSCCEAGGVWIMDTQSHVNVASALANRLQRKSLIFQSLYK